MLLELQMPYGRQRVHKLGRTLRSAATSVAVAMQLKHVLEKKSKLLRGGFCGQHDATSNL